MSPSVLTSAHRMSRRSSAAATRQFVAIPMSDSPSSLASHSIPTSPDLLRHLLVLSKRANSLISSLISSSLSRLSDMPWASATLSDDVCLPHDHIPQRFTPLHRLDGFIDLLRCIALRDQFIQFQTPLLVQVDITRHIYAQVGGAKVGGQHTEAAQRHESGC